MKNYSIKWLTSALNELAELWLNAADRVAAIPAIVGEEGMDDG